VFSTYGVRLVTHYLNLNREKLISLKTSQLTELKNLVTTYYNFLVVYSSDYRTHKKTRTRKMATPFGSNPDGVCRRANARLTGIVNLRLAHLFDAISRASLELCHRCDNLPNKNTDNFIIHKSVKRQRSSFSVYRKCQPELLQHNLSCLLSCGAEISPVECATADLE
jgi:hypothetical protein